MWLRTLRKLIPAFGMMSLLIVVVSLCAQQQAEPAAVRSGVPTAKSMRAPQGPNTVEDIPTLTRKALPAVVLVVASDKSGDEVRQGSGFLISGDGKVVTNYHVIEGIASAVVKLPNGAFYPVDGVLALDRDRDLAVLKISGRGLPFLPLGDSKSVQVGEQVIAIGSPLELESTVSSGIVSAIRELDETRGKVIQTTAAISPGSSGGALLNSRGQVIGVTAFQMTSGQNINFAIPADYIKPLLAASTVLPFKPGDEMAAEGQSRQTEGPEGPPSIPREWIQVQGGMGVTVRIEGDYLYEEGSFSADGVDITASYYVCDTKRQGTQWVGKCSYTIRGNLWDSLGNFVRVFECSFSLDEIITMVSPQRIEGESQETAPGPSMPGGPYRGVSRCLVPGTTRSHFVLIPKE
jgi:S1-C subfamily serine protease